ncbi:hypothetical protein EJB05_47376, partial [Eragrostis curvula]
RCAIAACTAPINVVHSRSSRLLCARVFNCGSALARGRGVITVVETVLAPSSRSPRRSASPAAAVLRFPRASSSIRSARCQFPWLAVVRRSLLLRLGCACRGRRHGWLWLRCCCFLLLPCLHSSYFVLLVFASGSVLFPVRWPCGI